MTSRAQFTASTASSLAGSNRRKPSRQRTNNELSDAVSARGATTCHGGKQENVSKIKTPRRENEASAAPALAKEHGT